MGWVPLRRGDLLSRPNHSGTSAWPPSVQPLILFLFTLAKATLSALLDTCFLSKLSSGTVLSAPQVEVIVRGNHKDHLVSDGGPNPAICN